MKVILFKDYKGLGKRGDVIKVKDGYARNFLIPNKIAMLYTPGNLKKFEMEKVSYEKKQQKIIESENQLFEALNGMELKFVAKIHDENTLYGSITEKHISEELSKKGIKVDKENIVMEEHIKHTGVFPVKIKLKFGKEAEIKVHILPEDGEKE